MRPHLSYISRRSCKTALAKLHKHILRHFRTACFCVFSFSQAPTSTKPLNCAWEGRDATLKTHEPRKVSSDSFRSLFSTVGPSFFRKLRGVVYSASQQPPICLYGFALLQNILHSPIQRLCRLPFKWHEFYDCYWRTSLSARAKNASNSAA